MIRSDPRRGYSLFEMLAVLSVSGVLMVVTAGWIHHSLKFSSSVKHRRQYHQTLTRLAWELRDDVGESRSILMEGADLVLQFDDETTITYRISGSTISAETQRPGAVHVQNKFVLLASSIAYWDTSEMPDWISLVVTRGLEGVPVASSELRTSYEEQRSNGLGSRAVDLNVRIGPNRWPQNITVSAISGTDEPAQGGKP